MARLWPLIMLLACEPQQGAGTPPSVASAAEATPPKADACRDDVPDCVAACALRETRRLEYIDFYERRCAAVVLGKNPDKSVAPPEPVRPPPQQATGDDRALEGRLPLVTLHDPFDPTSVSRMGGAEPAECRAARLLRAQKREREADMLDALCIAKGGDAGT